MDNPIINTKILASSPLRRAALTIAESAYKALDTQEIIRASIHRDRSGNLVIRDCILSLKEFDRVYLVGVGKSAYNASRALAPIIGSRLTKGFVIDIQGRSFGRVTVRRGTHPVPSLANIRATAELIAFLEHATARDCVIAIVSGGGSALMCQPTTMTCDQEVLLTQLLMARGATIDEMNVVRKHASRLRGGNMARFAYPARLIGLIFSDVCGNDLLTIASGPTVYDPTTVADARRIARKYHLPVKSFLETPKDYKYFRNVSNFLLGSNDVALEAMAAQARRLGFTPRIYSRVLQGIARDVGKELALACNNGEALIAGGETTVIVKNHGKGGRNQELVLGALEHLKDNEVVMSMASDGRDNTDAAGAIGDGGTVKRARQKHLRPQDYLEQNDSYHFFQSTNDLLFATRKATNVSDLMLVLRR